MVQPTIYIIIINNCYRQICFISIVKSFYVGYGNNHLNINNQIVISVLCKIHICKLLGMQVNF